MTFDVAVLGGGPAGAAAAIALCQRGRSVALLERTHHDLWRPGESLTPRVRDPLQALGLWQQFNNYLTPAPAHAIHVAWAGESHDRDSIFDAWGHGWTVDRRRLDGMLVDAAEAAGAVVHRGVPHIIVQGEPGAWRLADITARCFLDATGRTARVARTRGAVWRAHDRLVGVVARVHTAVEPAPVLHIEAAEHGWWYSAPLPDGALVVAFMTDADQWSGDATPFFINNLARSTDTRERLADHRIDGPLHVRPAGSGRLLPAAGPGWLAIGDAAATWDPLSGDGVLRALQAGIAAARRIDDISSNQTAAIHRSFEQYLDTRAAHYRRERRWPESRFWQRRHAPIPSKVPITLDPDISLRWHGAPPTVAEALLAPSELATLCALCSPARAADVVRAFRPHAPHYRDDQRAIVALQHLLSAGVLTAA
jgi:flavin-dependent dehydrogenase